MKIEVIDVGDGASTVVSCRCRPHDLTLIDCGVWRLSRTIPATAAERVLGQRIGDVSTVIVSHFDNDHWGGIQQLAKTRKFVTGQKVKLRFPAVPASFSPELPAGFAAMISTREDDPVNVITLAAELQAAGVVVTRHPMRRGETFQANAHPWTVLWPPKDITGHLAARIGTWLTDLTELADELEAAGDDRLKKNYETAYRAWEELCEEPPEEDDEDALDPDYWTSEPVSSARPEEGEPRRPLGERGRIEELVETGVDPGHDEGSALADEGEPMPPGFQQAPAHLREKLRKLAKRMAPLDNAMSLVVVDEWCGFVGFGDIEDEALKELLVISTGPQLRPHYRVMLAPHHGTHCADGLPGADLCVAQNGRRHAPNWHRHTSTHLHAGRCVCTAGPGPASVVWEDGAANV